MMSNKCNYEWIKKKSKTPCRLKERGGGFIVGKSLCYERNKTRQEVQL